MRKGEVFYSWGQGGKTLSLYGFSSDQRQVGSFGKEQGWRGRRGRQWLRLGGHRALSPGQGDLAGGWAGREEARGRPLLLQHFLESMLKGWRLERESYSAKLFSFSLW